MKRRPPRVATWLLQRLGPRYFAEALAGDLMEDFEKCPSSVRYCMEVAYAIATAQAELLRGGVASIVRGLVTSWAVLALALWAANGLEEHWVHRCPGCFYPRIIALTSPSSAHWLDLVQWGRWLVLLVVAHCAAGAALAWVPRPYRGIALSALILSMLNWKFPLVGGLMLHLVESRPEEGHVSNFIELGAALLGLAAGISLGSRAVTRRANAAASDGH